MLLSCPGYFLHYRRNEVLSTSPLTSKKSVHLFTLQEKLIELRSIIDGDKSQGSIPVEQRPVGTGRRK
jgi:hypothetical protein